MATVPDPAPNPTPEDILSGIRRHLEGLKGTRDGMVLFNLIERGLKRYGETGQIERAFINFVTTLLGRYAKDPTYDSATRIKARLIQQRLALHLVSAPVPGSPPRVPLVARKTVASTPSSASASEATSKVDSPMETLEHELVDRVTETLTAGNVSESGVPGDFDRAFSEFSDLKNVLLKGLDELIQERNALIRRIDGATGYLKALDGDRRRLREELTKARKHSAVDELTGLPKRDIFERSLEAEIGRVRRYGFAFALALLDVDGLGAINQALGRDAGDAVLRCYASEVLSSFRAYDLVSRYGDDEFAVLFPNTQKDGAMRALEKAQKTVTSTYVNHDGRSMRLPSFSSVLTIYAQGEKPAQLLRRASEALDNARLHGRNQIVVSLPSPG